jgi:colanic acid/amylovoran biosynthesis protein
MALALLAGKPVYMFPQSVGPLHRPWEGRLIRWLLERVRIVMVREPISLRLIQECGVRNPRCHLMPDVAFALPAAGREAGETWLRELGIDLPEKHPRLGMTMVNWGAQNPRFGLQTRYEAACAAAARFFIERYHGRVILFPQVWGPLASQDDRIPARRLAAQLADLADAVIVVEQPLPAGLLKSVYGWMDLFIGTRMHSNIFALSEGVPVIAIGYLHKTEGIACMAGVGEWAVDIQSMDEAVLVEKMRALWAERQAWREHILQVVPGLIRQARQAGKMVADDFFAVGQGS